MSDRRSNHNLIIFCIIFLAVLVINLLITSNPLYASSESALRSDINNLRTRIGYLEREVRRVSQRQNRSNPTAPELSPRTGGQVVDGEIIGLSDPMFERLSILVIELKERVMDLENRMDKIEEKTGI